MKWILFTVCLIEISNSVNSQAQTDIVPTVKLYKELQKSYVVCDNLVNSLSCYNLHCMHSVVFNTSTLLFPKH